jgi:hypothetical protein
MEVAIMLVGMQPLRHGLHVDLPPGQKLGLGDGLIVRNDSPWDEADS